MPVTLETLKAVLDAFNAHDLHGCDHSCGRIRTGKS